MSTGFPPRQKFAISPNEFRLLRDLICEYAGIQFDEDASSLVQRRLSERLEALGLDSFSGYYRYLRSNPRGTEELELALDRLTNKETYFFRQSYQLKAFEQELLPKLAQDYKSTKKLSIWNAGCATGEEAYTISLIIDQTQSFRDWEVRIIGSDISRTAIAAARRGVYGASSFRETPPEILKRCFTPHGQTYEIDEKHKKLCHFGQLNLLDTGRTSIVGRVHVAFCRNVLIYFDDRSKKRVIENIYDRLLPGGYLLVGHSESLLNLSTLFELCPLKGDLVYRKPLAAGQRELGS